MSLLQQRVNRLLVIGMKQVQHTDRPKTGRPLSFDRAEALHEAMLLFWRHGYESTSLSDLTAAMGITSPSIYTVFGDKKGLFREAVKLYLSGPVTSESIIEEAATAEEAARNLLKAAVIGYTGAKTPSGCLLATSAISCSEDAADVQREIALIRRGVEQRLKGKIVDDVRSGKMRTDVDADAIAAHIMAVIQGMSTLARDGAKRAKLERMIEVAMDAWPA
jgi:AcrR family transcriptional regulator